MHVRPLTITGAYEFTPRAFTDVRGAFVAPFQRGPFELATGHPLFPIAQIGHSRSRRGVFRGIHFTTAPPGMATYVYCSQGHVRDFVVDLRVGSPTFGAWDSVDLDGARPRGIFLPVGLGHGYEVRQDDTVITYMLSGGYVPEHERAVTVHDPELALPLAGDGSLVLSPRDTGAPTLATVRAEGGLPDYAECVRLQAALTEKEPR
ncbi:dTDP-4-dehydrorhamnose 3,5-epimerase family protein [Spiractinospora alimapuensis]|nr:dTDP-4-dehydrorhamnose 3,5-epimerase [Spiractinospora alimapuensis]QVQ55122.1 dTDP-4-dehydrorhamnose 3,5-epimerase family protein [Spiractinospora alimapuensis]